MNVEEPILRVLIEKWIEKWIDYSALLALGHGSESVKHGVGAPWWVELVSWAGKRRSWRWSWPNLWCSAFEPF